MEIKRIKKVRKIYLSLGYIFIGGLIVFCAMQIAFKTHLPVGVVLSGSMEPYINKGDLVFSRGTDVEYLREGDVIIFEAKGLWEGAPKAPVVHRIIEKWQFGGKWFFRTKGDANSYVDDAIIPESRIIGKVWGRVPYIGLIVVILIEGQLYISLSVVIVFLYISVIFVKMFVKNIR